MVAEEGLIQRSSEARRAPLNSQKGMSWLAVLGDSWGTVAAVERVGLLLHARPMTATDGRQWRCSRDDADGQVVPGKELPKLTEATSGSFVSTQEGVMWLYGPSRACCGHGEERDLGAVTGKRSGMAGVSRTSRHRRFALRGQ